MTSEEKTITLEMLDLIERIKNKTDNINKGDRIPELELEVILSKIEKLHQRAIVLKYLRKNEEKQIAEQIQFPENLSKNTVEKEEEQSVVETIEEVVLEKAIEMEEVKADMEALAVDDNGLTNEDLVEKLQQQPIKDIKQAIGINDKFLFTNELFDGNSEEFEKTINQLNNLSSMNEAKEVLKKYNWDNKNEVVQAFLSIVMRRYL